MFGYVMPENSNLRINEYDLYRASYCGLCHTLGKELGCLMRLSLSYDMAFFSIMRRYLLDEQPSLEKKRCIRHPFVSQNVVKPCDSLDFSALTSAILTDRKLIDTINDDKGLKRLSAKFIRFVLKNSFEKGKKVYPEIYAEVIKKLDELSQVEKEKTPSVDVPSEIFGEILGFMLSFGLEGKDRILANKIGISLGKFVYMADALDDFEDDKKSGNYNPFLLLYKDGIDGKEEQILLSICAELEVLGNTFELIERPEKSKDKEIIKNVIYLGLPLKIKEIIEKKGQKQ